MILDPNLNGIWSQFKTTAVQSLPNNVTERRHCHELSRNEPLTTP
jgi:hypothetical protein